MFLSKGMGCMSNSKSRGTVEINEAHTFYKDWNNVQILKRLLKIMCAFVILFSWVWIVNITHKFFHNFSNDTFINLFHATGLFLYPLKTSENQRFLDIFRGYRKRPVTWNGLKIDLPEKVVYECSEK